MKAIKELYRYTFKYKGLAFLVILFNLLYVVFNLISLALFVPFLQIIFGENKKVVEPEIGTTIIEKAQYFLEWLNWKMYLITKEDPKEALFIACVSIGIAFFGKTFFRYMAIWFQSQLRMAVVRDVRDKIFQKMVRLPLSYFTNEKKGDLISRMQSDVGEIENGVVSVLELFFRDPIAVVINIGVLVYWSPSLTAFSLLLLPIIGLIIAVIGKSLKRTAKEGQEQMGVLLSIIEESISGIKIIQGFNAVKQMIEKFRLENLKHQKLITKTFRKRDLYSPLNEFIVTLVMLVIVWYGGSLVLDQNSDLTGPEFLGFILVFSQLTRPISNTAKCIANLHKASASQERINEVLNTDEKIHDINAPVLLETVKKGVEYKNVCFKYDESQDWGLKNISFSINVGQSVALVGESGSGKSTIADLLPRFHDVLSGEIKIDGVNIRNIAVKNLRDLIGIVSQESVLFNASVKENIAFGMENATEEEIIKAAKIANAHDFIMALENGYETNIGERGNKLSGGQKQRISIARAILKNPPILILDEATSALDTESEKLVQEALEELMKGRTTLIIAHRLSTIKNADKILVLSKGEIVEKGTHEELLKKKGVYFKLSTLQGINH